MNLKRIVLRKNIRIKIKKIFMHVLIFKVFLCITFLRKIKFGIIN
jgi:hypothetical protein